MDREDGTDDAARAFAALQAEVSGLRRTIDGLPEVIAMRAPDYSPTLASLAQGLGRLEDGLAGIAGHPVLALSPQQHARALGEGAVGVLRTAAATVRTETEALGAERKALAEWVGQAMTPKRQRRVWLAYGAIGLALGLALFPLLAAFLPGGSHLAALAMGTRDRWLAGSTLLQVANPESAAALIAASRLSTSNAEALQACADVARRSGSAQRCIISVPGPER